jgi:hypothetical protein
MLKILLTTNSRGFALLPPSQTILNNQMKARAVWKKYSCGVYSLD